MTKETYILICGSCGHRNKRTYLPEYFTCGGCGECMDTDEYEIWDDGKKVKEL